MKENGVRKDIQFNYNRLLNGETSIEALASEDAFFVHQFQRTMELAVTFV